MTIYDDAIAMVNKLEKAGYSAYIVGGCVRDRLLGREPHDYDICTSATPIQVKEVFQDYDTYDTGLKHGTITVSGEQDLYEITTYRIDGQYKDSRHPESVQFVDNIELDLARRDFTINAMAWNPDRGLMDPFGGEKDIQDRLIRAVGNPNDRFQEDALRIMRAIRFSARYGFTIEPETYNALFSNKSLLQNIAQERKTSEFLQIIQKADEQHFEPFIPIFQEFVPEFKFLSEQKLKDNIKLMTSVDDLNEKLAALFDGIEARPLLMKLRMDNATIRAVDELSRYIHTPINAEKANLKRVMHDIGDIQTYRLLNLKLYYHDKILLKNEFVENTLRARELVDEIIENREPYLMKDLKINGNDLIELGFKGAQIGEELNRLLDAVIITSKLNTRDQLLEIANEDLERVHLLER